MSSYFPRMSHSFVASHFPTSPIVPIGFLVLCFPFIPPALPLFSFLSLACPFQFPFVSLSFPAAFLSCRLPVSSPCISPLLPNISRKKHGFSSVFAEFSRFSAKGGRNPKPAKSRQGESSLGPLFCDTGSPKTTFSGTSSNCRAVRGGGGGGGREKKAGLPVEGWLFWFLCCFSKCLPPCPFFQLILGS